MKTIPYIKALAVAVIVLPGGLTPETAAATNDAPVRRAVSPEDAARYYHNLSNIARIAVSSGRLAGSSSSLTTNTAGSAAQGGAPGVAASKPSNNQTAGRAAAYQQGRHPDLAALDNMQRSLSLNDEQAKNLAPVLKEQQDKLNALRRDTSLSRKDRVAKLKEIQQGADAKIKAQLTPEQAAKWQQVRANPGRFMQPPGQNAARTNAFSIGQPGGGAQPALPAWQSRSPRPGQPQPQPPPSAQHPAQAVSPK